jgi:hypothetical protein
MMVLYNLVALQIERWCRSGFTTLSPVPLQEQPVVVLLLEGALVSWLRGNTVDTRIYVVRAAGA